MAHIAKNEPTAPTPTSLVPNNLGQQCFLCNRELTTKKKSTFTPKGFHTICHHLDVDYADAIYSKGQTTFCKSCTKSAQRVLKLHDRIESLQLKLKELVASIRNFTHTSNGKPGGQPAVPRQSRGVFGSTLQQGSVKDYHLKTLSPGSLRVDADGSDSEADDIASSDRADRMTQKFKTEISKRRRKMQIQSDSDSDTPFSPPLDYEDVEIYTSPAEIQIKVEPDFDAFFGGTVCGNSNAETDEVGQVLPRARSTTKKVKYLSSSGSSSFSSSSSSGSSDSDSDTNQNDQATAVDAKRIIDKGKGGRTRTPREKQVKAPKEKIPFFKEISDGRLVHGKYEIVKVEKGYQCVTCGSTRATMQYMRSHIKTEHLIDTEYICDVCGKVYLKLRSFQRHKLHLHVKGGHPCETCGKPIKSWRTYYEKHRWTHFSKEDIERAISAGQGKPPKKCILNRNPQPCRYCGKLIGRLHMSTHEKIHLQGERTFQCDKCPKSYASIARLKAHERVVHTSDKNRFQCSICFKTFKMSSILKKHIIEIHCADRPFECAVCGKGFKRESYLKVHTQTAHSDERPYKCDTCSKTYRFENSLRRHKREVGCPGELGQ